MLKFKSIDTISNSHISIDLELRTNPSDLIAKTDRFTFKPVVSGMNGPFDDNMHIAHDDLAQFLKEKIESWDIRSYPARNRRNSIYIITSDTSDDEYWHSDSDYSQ